MSNILTIFTGGTIGCAVSGGVMNVNGKSAYMLIDSYARTHNNNVQFTAAQPIDTLSENLRFSDLIPVINTVLSANSGEYDGIIITHGSDTLPFTSAVLSYALAGIGLPVIITAANYPLTDERTNGFDNFAAAVDLINNASLCGVYVTFRENNGKMNVYSGVRLLEATPFDDEFHAYQSKTLGEMKNGRLHVFDSESVKMMCGACAANRPHNINFAKNILKIQPYPSLDYSYFNFNENPPAAVMHGLYHSSTACVKGKSNSLIDFAKYCADYNADLYLYDACHWSNENAYSSAVMLKKCGAVPVAGISEPALLAKLAVAYNSDIEHKREYIQTNICGEFI